MTKKEYIKRQISRTNKKDYENYVITRVIHKLDDLDIKFVTQQYVKRPEGRGLADMYFPQINLFVEVDEAHHLTQEEADKVRDADFENATGSVPRRIEVANSTLEQINNQIDELVEEIKQMVTDQRQSGGFIPWDIDWEMNPDTWIEKGSIHVNDKVAFRKIVDGCKCMGLDYNGFQQAGVKHPFEQNTLIWFPKLYLNDKWANDFDETLGIIIEKNVESDEKRAAHVQAVLNGNQHRRIVFARVRGMLGDIQYRFRGVFELDKTTSNNIDGLIWRRVSEEAKTYEYNKEK